MPSSGRQLGSFVTIGSAVYYSGGAYAPAPGNPALLEVYYGSAVAATASPTPSPSSSTTGTPSFAPTVYSTTEPWTTKKAMPLSGMEDVGQSCAGVTSATGSFYYQYRGNSPFGPYPAADMMKYTAATDAWSLGTRPSPTLCA
jgi:hypothetical protein